MRKIFFQDISTRDKFQGPHATQGLSSLACKRFLELPILNFTFHFTAPTAAPVNLTVVNITSSSLHASWSPPPTNETHGHIRHYLIKYWEVQCSKYRYGTVNGTVKERTVGSNNHSAIIDGLKYWKCYQVNVTAVTVGEGPYATNNETRTSENGINFHSS